MKNVDVLVVGAGPAGSMAAYAAAGAGLRAFLVEKKQTIGLPVRCGEYVPAPLSRELPDGLGLPTAQRLSGLVVHVVAQDSLHEAPALGQRINAPGAIIQRGALDQMLAAAAADRGAKVVVGMSFCGIKKGVVTLRAAQSGRLETIRPRCVIGADGPISAVGRSVGLGPSRLMLALQRACPQVPASTFCQEAHFFFWPGCRFGYGWFFPKGQGANIGVAVPRGQGRQARDALAQLETHLRDLGAASDSRSKARGGLVPCGGPLPVLGRRQVLLAGDAAGQTDALTGAGIVAAIRGGALAGHAVAEALSQGKPNKAAGLYESLWRKHSGAVASRALHKRNELEALWDVDLSRAVKRSWL